RPDAALLALRQQRGDGAAVEAPTLDGRASEHGALAGLEAVDARREDCVQRGRQRSFAGLGLGGDELLEEQRVAFRRLDDPAPPSGGPPPRPLADAPAQPPRTAAAPPRTSPPPGPARPRGRPPPPRAARSFRPARRRPEARECGTADRSRPAGGRSRSAGGT